MKNILIVEDEAIISMDLSQILTQMGYNICDTAVSAPQAIESARQNRPDLIIMDINLGSGTDGVEAAKTISGELNIPIVYLTGATDNWTLHRTLETNPYGYIHKPINEKTLQFTLETALNKFELEKNLKESKEQLERTNRELTDSEERFRMAFRTHPDAIAITRMKDGLYIDINDGFVDLTGYSREEVIGKTSNELNIWNTPADRERCIREMQKNGRLRNMEINIRDRSGKTLTGLFSASTITISNEPYLLTIMRDITERNQMEADLRESVRRFNEILEHSRDILYRISLKEGTIDYAGAALARITGIPMEEIIGSGPEVLNKAVHPEDLERIQRHREKSLTSSPKEETNSTIEYRVRDKHGNYLWWSDNITLIRDDEGRPTHIIGNIRDMTQSKFIEEQLQRRQKMDSLGTLASGIAHDFNNLLVGIIGYLDLLHMDAEDLTETQKEHIEMAIHSAQRAADLIKKFQTLSSGSGSQKSSVDLFEVANEVFGLIRETTDRLIEKRNLVPPRQYYVHGNSLELSQVLLNLATNALHAIEEKGVNPADAISIEAEEYHVPNDEIASLPPGRYIHILFRDTGAGMTEEVKRLAFDPMFTTKDKGKIKGQGLGLAMVYTIVTRNHDGFITIESQPGAGSVFHIYLPAAKERQESESSAIKMVGGDETILIIDDEDTVRNFVEFLLKKFGYTVITAPDGRTGLDYYKKNSAEIDLVILDLTMPMMSGQMVLEKLMLINPEVRVIISSGYGEDIVKRGILTHARGYVTKPYQINELISEVRRTLDS